MIAYTNLLRCIENLGIAGAYGIRYYGQGKITHDNYVQLIRHFTLVDEYLEQSKNYVPQIGKGKRSQFLVHIVSRCNHFINILLVFLVEYKFPFFVKLMNQYIKRKVTTKLSHLVERTS